MTTTTRKQREAIYRRWVLSDQGLDYRRFRKSVQATFGCDGAVVVYWCKMWLCIERDGYCHS